MVLFQTQTLHGDFYTILMFGQTTKSGDFSFENIIQKHATNDDYVNFFLQGAFEYFENKHHYRICKHN